MLTVDRLREILRYDPDTGEFEWTDAASRRFSGKRAGRVHKVRGYREINVDGRLYYAHRLAWFYVSGQWPVGMVDHKDHARDNNRWSNLRIADSVTNGQNRRGAQSNSETGVLGVSRNGTGYRARLHVDGREVHLGTFRSIDAAATARAAAKRIYHVF